VLNLDDVDAIFFDCDGVILDSNEVKSSAFAEALEDEPPELIEEFIKYHKENGGVSRYTKFSYYFSHIRGMRDFDEKYQEALARYEALTRERLLDCSYIPGVLPFLHSLKESGKRLYVVSGGAEAELHEVFMKRGIFHLFDGIYGSPKNKIENMEEIMSSKGRFDNGVYFGDANSDRVAAEMFGARFVFVSGKSEWREGGEACRKNGITIIKDFEALAI
jgi:phosphoglycolate phosphatase-like HAD superfamily hydrolase